MSVINITRLDIFLPAPRFPGRRAIIPLIEKNTVSDDENASVFSGTFAACVLDLPYRYVYSAAFLRLIFLQAS